jgi:hypothetical protein
MRPALAAGKLVCLAALILPCRAREQSIARLCASAGDCNELVVRNNVVEFVSTGLIPRRLTIGRYVPSDQPLVGKGEAPILDLSSGTDWHIVVTAGFFYGSDPTGPYLAAYLFGSRGKLWTKTKMDMSLENYGIGDLLGTAQEFLEITTGGPHAYAVHTFVWLLPRDGPPKLLLNAYGMLDRIEPAHADRPGGLWVEMQTYDGLHSETKGWRSQFWRWDQQSLRLEPVKGS